MYKHLMLIGQEIGKKQKLNINPMNGSFDFLIYKNKKSFIPYTKLQTY